MKFSTQTLLILILVAVNLTPALAEAGGGTTSKVLKIMEKY